MKDEERIKALEKAVEYLAEEMRSLRVTVQEMRLNLG